MGMAQHPPLDPQTRLERLPGSQCERFITRLEELYQDHPDSGVHGAAGWLLRQWGQTVLLTDGDVVFQPRKVERSGLWEAVNSHVLIYIHKELALDDVEARYPALHYVLVDDKPRILAAVKEAWGVRVTTVFPRQGQYAHDAKALASFAEPDVTVDRIGDLLDCDLGSLLTGRSRLKALQG